MNGTAGGTSVLVVDDEPTVREVVVGYLRRDGHNVSEAADGPAAIAQLESGSFDLVVLDMMLPGVNGLDILRRIRATGDYACYFTPPVSFDQYAGHHKFQVFGSTSNVSLIMLRSRAGGKFLLGTTPSSRNCRFSVE